MGLIEHLNLFILINIKHTQRVVLVTCDKNGTCRMRDYLVHLRVFIWLIFHDLTRSLDYLSKTTRAFYLTYPDTINLRLVWTHDIEVGTSVFWLFVGEKVYICLQVPTHSFMNSLSSSVKFHNLMLPSADEESRFFSNGWVVICQIASSWAGQFPMQKLLLSVGP